MTCAPGNCVVARSGPGKILGLYLALVGPHLGCTAQFWFPCCGKDVGSLGAAGGGGWMAGVIRGLRYLPCKDRLERLGLHSLERGRAGCV